MTTQLLGDDPAPDERGDVSVADFDTIGPYRVLQQLGQGGMGIVHLALDARGRAVAVKVLRTHVAHDDDARARLAREVDTLARVRSQRIAPVFDADLEAEQPYIVTRYVPGPSLEQLVREEGWRRELLHTLIQRFRRGATALGLDLMLSATPIQPILVGDSARALALSAALRRRGILVTAIRPPTVPAGCARLRVTLTAAHREAHVDLLLDALAQAMAELPPDADK
mgnify:CR=1 FL=1